MSIDTRFTQARPDWPVIDDVTEVGVIAERSADVRRRLHTALTFLSTTPTIYVDTSTSDTRHGTNVLAFDRTKRFRTATSLDSALASIVPQFAEQIAITPDQAPIARLSAIPGAVGTASKFSAAGSAGPSSPIVSYRWNFGDGTTATTTAPTATHTYRTAKTYTASVTETDKAGTSTQKIFTGQTMSRNGGPSATATATVVIS